MGRQPRRCPLMTREGRWFGHGEVTISGLATGPGARNGRLNQERFRATTSRGTRSRRLSIRPGLVRRHVKGERTMRFLITAAPDPDAPKGAGQVDDDLFAAYMRFNEEMHRAGVLVASE